MYLRVGAFLIIMVVISCLNVGFRKYFTILHWYLNLGREFQTHPQRSEI